MNTASESVTLILASQELITLERTNVSANHYSYEVQTRSKCEYTRSVVWIVAWRSRLVTS